MNHARLQALSLAISIAASATAGARVPPDPVVIALHGRTVTASELERAIEYLPPPQQSGYRQQPILAARWLGRLLALSDEARRRGLAAPASPALSVVDEANGLTSALIQRIASDTHPSAAETEAYWRAHRDDFAHVRVRHVFVADAEDAAAKAADIASQVARGGDIAELARRFCDDPTCREHGGDWGMLSRGQRVPEVDRVLWRLVPKEVSAPIRTGTGYEIVQVDERIVPPLSEVMSVVEGRLRSEIVERELESIVRRSRLTYDLAALDRLAHTARQP